MAQRVWVVGRWKGHGDIDAWIITGIFNTENEAVRTVRDINDFVGPIELGVDLGPDYETWPGCYYPKASEIYD